MHDERPPDAERLQRLADRLKKPRIGHSKKLNVRPRRIQARTQKVHDRAHLQRAPYRPGRWLDGTPRNCFAVFVLTRLFPAARFIHIVRDVNEVVTALSSDDTRRHYRSRYLGLTPKEAYQHWLDATRACLDAELAFGSSVVMAW